ncbi:MAG TPA: dihydroorotate dehydrogenase-like protein [Atribacterota bacterium]|nr:dihydroorotate dehydrogenase-like protein [Atribacterota bacterium]
MDLSTEYLGIKLKNPLVASSSPLCEDIENIRLMEKSGISAVVLHSLFEEQVILQEKELNYALTENTERYAESLSYFPEVDDYHFAPEEYIKYIDKVKKAVQIPVIGSLNGVSNTGWIRYSKKIEEAGADGLELNIYYLPTRVDLTCQELEKMYLDLVQEVRQTIKIPLAVKLGPYFNSFVHFCDKLVGAGVDGLILFNRFYQPDVDLLEMSVSPNLELSSSSELRLRLRWIGILYNKIKADLAVTGGIHTAKDILKSIMVGAKVTMMTSALLEQGIPYVETLVKGTEEWLSRNNYQSIDELRGILTEGNVKETDAFERANYMKVLQSYHYE